MIEPADLVRAVRRDGAGCVACLAADLGTDAAAIEGLIRRLTLEFTIREPIGACVRCLTRTRLVTLA